MSRTLEFKRKVFNKVGNEYTVLGEYKNNKTKILIRHNCNLCNNHEYYVIPNIKRDYCKINKIKLLEIPYWELDNIENILSKYLGGDANDI